MKLRSITSFLFAASLISIQPISARNPFLTKNNAAVSASYKTEAGNCSIPVSQYDLSINNVRARLLNAGDLWWDLNTAHYEVPKGNQSSGTTYPNAIFAGSIWVSGIDQANNLKIAAQEYRTGGTSSDYFTGPLDATGNIASSQCNKWDRHFNVYGYEINALINAFLSQGSVPSSVITQNLKNWPGKGNAYLASQGYDVSGPLAPFFDTNSDGIYNPADGDYPSLLSSPGTPNTYANQMIFWVMNDMGNTHTGSNGQPMGIQINALAYAFQTLDELNDMTFYNYSIINKSSAAYSKTYISQFTDVDLGCSENDRIGCDTSHNMAIAYNGTLGVNSCDNGTACLTGAVGYGCDLPILGISMLDAGKDTAIDPITQSRKKLKMSSFIYFSRAGSSGMLDPTTASEYRNYQTGKWRDGQPMVSLGDGRTGSGNPYPYAFSGDPAIATDWSECNTQTSLNISAGDRRFLQSTGPFTFLPGSSQSISLSVIFVQPPGGVGSNCPGWSAIKPAADKAQTLFDSRFASLMHTGISEIESNSIKLFPNPVSKILQVSNSNNKPIEEIKIYDTTGKLVIQSYDVTSVNIEALPSGIYLVKVGNAAKAVKIVKE
jgi:hypothetical protein